MAVTKEEIVERARALAKTFAGRAEAAEEGRRLPAQSTKEMLDAGFARILMPARFGGYELDLDTWNDVVIELSRADASHGWCAALIIHHAHILAAFPEACQQAIWADGPDVAIAASFAPRAKAVRVDGGYRVTAENATYASGVDNCTWVMLGGFIDNNGAPEWVFFMVPPGGYSVRDVWFTAGMKGTGSNTIVTDNVFVPDSHILKLTELRQGKGPGAVLHEHLVFRTPFFFYAPLTFAAPMLGAAQGAYAHFREWSKERKSVDGSAVSQKLSVQVQMARAAADLDAAELLLQRAAMAHHGPEPQWQQLLARTIRDYTRVAELSVSAIDTILALSGTAGFASSQPIQRAWRDIHFASTHIGVNPEANYGHYGRMEFGLPRDPSRPFF
jgi:3-hydroxy-9,10-secoandrosta-1,3,5(10)-triene-9,17-dione monooxygenase